MAVTDELENMELGIKAELSITRCVSMKLLFNEITDLQVARDPPTSRSWSSLKTSAMLRHVVSILTSCGRLRAD